ncbi:DEAD/DEAH box helicase [Clostridium sp. HCP1S3_B4]|uniref:DEAD/DEAH box helicase n=1 Tax=unclassified Clostridium TaxID=2614128 RepID=UPI002A7953BA|nr:DEAD/DEAH box helicase [Clostridiales bacterium]MDY2728911.1 DEAD/DEAH box helicase [Clostridium sp.]
MIKQAFLEGFRKTAKGNNEEKGNRVLKNDLISEFNVSKESEDRIVILSSVISENLFNEYSCKIDIDKNTKNILFTHCSCIDFQKHESKKNYCCKHLVASFYEFLNKIDNDDELRLSLGLRDENLSKIVRSTEGSILDFLLQSTKSKKPVFMQVIINKISWSNKICAEFKIGENNKKVYSIKDINGFLIALSNNIPIKYGKDFEFCSKTHNLNLVQKKLIRFINMLKDIDLNSSFKKTNERLVSGKHIIIPKALIKEFFMTIKPLKVYLGANFYSRVIETEILESKIPFPLNLKKIGNMFKLEAERGMPEKLGNSDEVYLYNTSIYLPPESQIEATWPYIEAFSHGNTIFFSENEEERILKDLIPNMQRATSDVVMSKAITEKVVSAPVKFKFYFDKNISKNENNIVLTLKVSYDKYEFNYLEDFTEKVIYRDLEKENMVVEKIRKLGFEPINNIFMFFKDESYIFDFFKYNVKELQDIGEVYYSDRFTGIKKITKGSFNGQIKKGKYDYFEMKFEIEDIPYEETYKILQAFRDSKKYYRLKSGEFLDLEEIEMKKFLKLLDTLNDKDEIKNNSILFNKNKGYYAADYLEEEDITYLKGSEDLKTLRDSIKEFKNTSFELPKNLKATLRPYQVFGYNYLKTLDTLGFGGILGDEMGLGKTIQTISFIASNPTAKTLIVAPTSLIYNWLNEFKKFTNAIKICALIGPKAERRNNLNNIKKYDVFITTYNILKRDIELYNEITFTYCILDEAQNIKNPLSQNAKACKNIKANRKFALTGTPLENSLMELWSIFDFIMPGYLYDEKRFRAKYYRKLDEDKVLTDNLNMLIKPFILRRYKKDVLKELPDKIENKFIVPMEKRQMEVYETYVNHVKDIIEKKVKDNEFKSSKIEILSYITKLRQICLHPSVVMDNYKGGSGKFNALLDILNQSIDEGHKILLFSQFTSILKLIAEMLKKYNISFSYLDGSTQSKTRIKLVEDFNSNDTSVFLISLKAGGTGLNLTSADIVIHFDPWWNPAVEDQATDRAHRIGQKNIVEVIKMVSEGTIEEKILSLQDEKKNMINKIIGKDSLDESINLTTLSEEELLALFCR